MSWKDAATVSCILSLGVYFTTFILPYDLEGIQMAPFCFVFDSAKFFGSVFFTNFIALAGLTQYIKKKEEAEELKA